MIECRVCVQAAADWSSGIDSKGNKTRGSVPFATDASLAEELDSTAAVEADLLALNLEKERVRASCGTDRCSTIAVCNAVRFVALAVAG
jgi:hypothetical protein